MLDFMKNHTNIQQEVREAQHKIKSCFEDIQRLRVSIDDISNDLKHKACQTDVFRIEKELHHMCPMSYAQQMTADMRKLATVEDLNLSNNSIKQLSIEIYANFYSKQDAKREVSHLENHVEDLFFGYAKSEKVDKICEVIMERCKNLESINDMLKLKIEQSNEFLKALINQNVKELDERVKKEELKDLENQLSEMATKTELFKVQSETYPRLTNFCLDLEKFNSILKEQEKALSRLDEIILEKASKIDMRDLTNKLKVISKHSDSENKIDEIVENIKNLSSKTQQSLELSRKSELKINEVYDYYRKKINEIAEQRTLKDTILELNTTISYKVDRSEFFKLLEEMASNESVSNLSTSIETVHKQIKLLAVQLGAVQKTFAAPTAEKGNIRSKKDHFYKITQRLVEYIVNSQPVVDKTVGEEFKSFLKLPDPIRISTPEPPRTITPSNRLLTPHRKVYYSFENN